MTGYYFELLNYFELTVLFLTAVIVQSYVRILCINNILLYQQCAV